MNDKTSVQENQQTENPDESPEQVKQGAAEAVRKEMAELTQGLSDLKIIKENAGTSKAEVDAIKADVKATHESIGKDLTSFTELKSKVIALIKDSENKAKQISEEHESLETQLTELKKSQLELKDFLDGANKTKADVEASRDAVATAEQSVNQTKARFDALTVTAQASNTEMAARQSDASAKAAQIEAIFNQTKQKYDDLFTDEKDANGVVIKKSVNSQIEELHSNTAKRLEEAQKELVTIRDNLAVLEANTKKDIQHLRDDAGEKMVELSGQTKDRFEALYVELKDRVESLLPGAGAAGLASTYFEAKSKYGFTPFKVSADEKNPIWARIAHYGKTSLVTLAFYGMFLVPLAGIAYMFWQILGALAEHPDDKFNPNIFFFRLLITIPLGIISGFGWTSIRLYRQMYEEYNYKQRVMQLYHSFKSEIAEEGTADQKQTLLQIMLNAVGAKPDLGMHDLGIKDMFVGLIDKVSLSGGKKGE